MKHGSLFNGIGGFQLAAEWMGWENVFSCEIDEWCNKVTKKHFPNCIQHGDIKTTDFTIYRGRIDIITGGFPCQPYSVAGKRKGTNDDRHLWPEMLRVIREIQPGWIVGENVPGLLNWERGLVLDQIKTDLENSGFEVFPSLILPACGKNAPHRRDRLWIVAHSDSNGKMVQGRNRNSLHIQRNSAKKIQERKNFFARTNRSSDESIASDTHTQRLQRRIHGKLESVSGKNESFAWGESSRTHSAGHWNKFPTQSPVCGGDDGIPNRVDRLKGLGNAIVPQVAYEIFKAIESTNS